ncbi:MAG: hypothetical protein ABIJ26_06605 [Candidatus Margulisiibacteriota bacterium]|nr:hypothetical protein [Candidatus Margulisiibacteriota bacterium]
MKLTKKIFILLLLAGVLSQAPRAEEKLLTKESALENITATEVVKGRIEDFLSWTVGYDTTKVNRVKLVPIINYVHAAPKQVPPDGRTVLEVTASVDDPGGLVNIRGVRANLTGIGKFRNMALVDNGLYGDIKAGDGVYTLQANVNPRIAEGDKEIPVTVSNRRGWLTKTKTNIQVANTPLILQAYADKSKYNPGSTVILTLKADNPGNIRDISDCSVNLSQIGLGEYFPMQKIQDGIYVFEFVLPAQISSGKKNIPLRVTNISDGQAIGTITIEVTQ